MLEAQQAGEGRALWPVMIFGDQPLEEALNAHVAQHGPVPDGREVFYIRLVGTNTERRR